MINIAASPFHYKQASNRREVLVRNALRYNLPLFYVNHIGAQTELLFDGGSMVITRDGEIFDEFNYFEEDFRIYELKEGSNQVSLFYNEHKPEKQKSESKISLIHDALVMGIRNYFQKLGFSKAIIGLSGGIDSAVTLALAARALGNDNVKAVLLPSRYSSEHSINDAVALAENLNVPYDIIHVEKAFKSFEETMSQWFDGLPADITEENLQARIRAVILMSLSNKFGYILLNTSNKSEAAVGYGTLYGDMCGGLSVLGDVYKTEVFDLAGYINRSQPIIPEHTISKPPSAELRPGQKDSDSLPDYEILDDILYQYIELRKGPGELIDLGYSKETVSKILKLVNTSEHKRYQMPPVLRVSTKAFGMGRRMPIVARYLS
jgi:NAD+ synthase (glutamine-hydrolysing)